MNIVIRNKKNEIVDIWADWSGVVPTIGDTIVARTGDHKEITINRVVLGRFIDVNKPDKVTLIIDFQ